MPYEHPEKLRSQKETVLFEDNKKSPSFVCWEIPTLAFRYKLSLVYSDICKAPPITLFWAHSGLNKSPEMHFEFPFNLIGKSTMAF